MGLLDPIPESGGLSRVRGPIHAAMPATAQKPRRRDERPRIVHPRQQYPPKVYEARAILRNGSIIIAGGDFRKDAADRIQAGFKLRELDWTHTSKTDASHVKLDMKPDLRCVVVLLRYIRHHTHDAVQAWCRGNGTPLVTVTGGYGVNQLAHAIVARLQHLQSSKEDA